MIMDYKNRPSTEFGLNIKKVHRPLIIPVREATIEIPGRHGKYSYDPSTFENFQLPVEIDYYGEDHEDIRQKARQISAWLTSRQYEPLRFSDEPDKFYLARIYDTAGLETLWSVGMATITFDCQPFAYSDLNMTEVTRTNDDPIFIFNNGSVETPAEYTVTNQGASALNTIRIKVIQRI